MCMKKLRATVNINNDKEGIAEHLKGMCLEYYIIEMDGVERYENNTNKSYGVEIIKKEITTDNTTYMENSQVNDICCCENSIKDLVDKLVHHTVTPIALNNVLEDIIGVV